MVCGHLTAAVRAYSCYRVRKSISLSLCKTSFPPVPRKTAELVKSSLKKNKSLYVELDKLLEDAYKDFDFSPLYSVVGRDGLHPQVLLRAVFIQYIEGLTDRKTIEQIADRNSFKYFLHQPPSYSGFDPSTLSDFRSRLLDCDSRDIVLQPLLDAAKKVGLLKGEKQRTDSTHILMAARELNQLELCNEALRFALEDLADSCLPWLKSIAKPHWYERYSVPCFNFRIPKKEKEKVEWIRQLAEDGAHLISHLEELEEPHISSSTVSTLLSVWSQQFIFDDEDISKGRFRTVKEYVVQASEMIVSPQDTDSRLGTKRDVSHKGYKTHLTETIDPEMPHLITNIETTDATVADLDLRRKIENRLQDKQMTLKEHTVDSGYTDTKSILESRNDGIDVIGEMREATHWQAKEGKGFDLSGFKIDFVNEVVECPQGKISVCWSPRPKEDSIHVRFASKDCKACPFRTDCTKGKGPRTIQFKIKDQYNLLKELRARQVTDEFKGKYSKRAGIEGTISQAVRRTGLRRTRYVGNAKTFLHCVLSATALNLIRLYDWFCEKPLAQTRISKVIQLKAA